MEARRKGIFIFIAAGLALTLALVLFVSPWASSSPDGLEKVAEEKGFIEKSEETDPAWEGSPAPDYAVPGVDDSHPALATALAGLAGTVAIFLIAWGLALILKKKGSGTGVDTSENLMTEEGP
jgi:cobalt/nickel transport protein